MGSCRLPKCDVVVKQVKPYWYISASFFSFSLFFFDFSIFLNLIFFLIFFPYFFSFFCFLVGVGDGGWTPLLFQFFHVQIQEWVMNWWWMGFAVSKNYYTSLSCSWLNISQLEAALPAARCSQDPPPQAGSVVQQLEVLQGFESPWCDGPFQHIYKLADADLLTSLCSSIHSAHASAHEWLHWHAAHADLSSSLLVRFPVALG